jgi:hypothetical protein
MRDNGDITYIFDFLHSSSIENKNASVSTSFLRQK